MIRHGFSYCARGIFVPEIGLWVPDKMPKLASLSQDVGSAEKGPAGILPVASKISIHNE
jgi:hypothetical protein